MISFEGKKGLIVGVANDKSIAWHIAKHVLEAGGDVGFTHLPDKPGSDRQKNRGKVEKLTKNYPGAKFLEPLDVTSDEQLETIAGKCKEEFGTIDFVLHSVAFASLEDLKTETVNTSRDGFKMAMEISAYSLIALSKAVRPILSDNSSILTMTYFGGERCVPGYNVMGICKAALDAAVKYLAYDMGPAGTRVNALSAGPLRTLASSAVGAKGMEALYEHMAPMARNITHDEVGQAGAFLLSSAASGISAEIMHVDAGYNAMGSPGRLLDEIAKAQNA
jgi:enoyl-[acyl-carrier protein] reductase I